MAMFRGVSGSTKAMGGWDVSPTKAMSVNGCSLAKVVSGHNTTVTKVICERGIVLTKAACRRDNGQTKWRRGWAAPPTKAWSRPDEGDVRDDVPARCQPNKDDVRAWCHADKVIFHKARWGPGNRCQARRRMGTGRAAA
ncbi:hypothetical protein DFH09DRAFT_1067459 [Mycena vulgaris]|nr:hypothetical protein DFH09DRAFT_1067459 [Mycena vulgaris]